MNPHASSPTSPLSLIKSLLHNRGLIVQMTKREVLGRYKGSVIGIGWSFFNPLLMLLVYTFVFSVVFKARWGIESEGGKTQFAVILFTGMIVHAFFSEVLNRSTSIILSNINYVKKVIFPLEILPIVSMGASLFHACVSLFVLLVAFFVFNGFVQWTVVLFPIVLAPLLLITLGMAWFLTSIGVFIRDAGYTVGFAMTILLFLSPVFYPVSALPEQFQTIILLNPLTFIIEQSRNILVFGKMPHWFGMFIYWLISICIFWMGYWWFQKTRKGFADVV